MEFDFSEDQKRLQEEVGRMLAAVSTSAEVREVLEGRATHSAATWRQLGVMGAAGAVISEEHGGADLGYLTLCLIAQEAGRHLVAAPLLSSVYLAAEAISMAGSDTQKKAWLPGLASGERIATAVLGRTERVVAADPLRLEGGRLLGSVHAVPDAMIATLAVLLVGDRLFIVDLGGAGVARAAADSLDPTRPIGSLIFSGAEAEPLGDTLDQRAIADRVRNGAAVLLAFEQLGGTEQALDVARDYALERRAFGRVIGGFQAVRHKLADIYVAKELAKVHAYYGAWALASGAPELPRAAAAARVAATTAYNFAATESLHLHGGIGYTWEMDCHLHLRRARWLAQILGSEHHWRMRLADHVIEEAA